MAEDWTADLRTRIDELLDTYRDALHDSLDGLTEEEARVRLVPSDTTLLGLLEHATFVEGFWFDLAVNGGTTQDVGIASSPARSFVLEETDTIASVQAAHRARVERSRQQIADLELDTTVTGKGERPFWAVLLQVLRELAQHAGHADILREQVLARRAEAEA